MILLCEECWQKISDHRLDDIRKPETRLKYEGRGKECAFYHVFDHNRNSATKRLKQFNKELKQ